MPRSSTEDKNLFIAAMAEVTRLAEAPRAKLNKKQKNAVEKKARAQTALVSGLSDSSEHLDAEHPQIFRRNGISSQILRKLKQGQWPIEAEIDLHGLNRDEARNLLDQWIDSATQQQCRCVCVINGQGYHSKNEDALGVLKKLVPIWLSQKSSVLAFCPMPQNAGGSGALRVLLKSAT